MTYDRRLLSEIEYQNMLDKQRKMEEKSRFKDEYEHDLKNREMKRQVFYSNEDGRS